MPFNVCDFCENWCSKVVKKIVSAFSILFKPFQKNSVQVMSTKIIRWLLFLKSGTGSSYFISGCKNVTSTRPKCIVWFVLSSVQQICFS
jgi:hypothetical protein